MKRVIGEEISFRDSGESSEPVKVKETLQKIQVDIFTNVNILLVRLWWAAKGRRYCEDIVATQPWTFFMEAEDE